jgi:class 3 adenylate cyclase
MAELPTGTVTFLFTDIEGSTKLWEQQPEAMRQTLTEHDALLRATNQRHHGALFKTVGDAFFAVFAQAGDEDTPGRSPQIASHRPACPHHWSGTAGQRGPAR